MDNIEKLERMAQIIESCNTKEQVEACLSFSDFQSTFFQRDDEDSRLIVKDMVMERMTSMHLLN